MFYPYNLELQKELRMFDQGNFSLWFNKLVPLNNENKCKACDQKENDKEAVQYYKAKYDILKKNIHLKKMLEQKHISQKCFCDNLQKAGYETLLFKAKLNSPLITGIGQPHPNEVGMVFDHTMGIPYIPSSSLKGIIRFAHTLGLIGSDDFAEFIYVVEKEEYINEANEKTMIPVLFGGDLKKDKNGVKESNKVKGMVIFLDAYPKKVPDLHIDIMNPHYGDYYIDKKGTTPPADYLDPTPIKFLTVKPETIFIFRTVIPKISALNGLVTKAFERALTIEGIGAKTAVGYGRFNIIKTISESGEKKDKEQSASSKESARKEIWTQVYLTWSPGNQIITASCKNKKATVKGKEIVPESLSKKLFRKKKASAARVEVEAIGNAFRIVKIFED